MTINHTPAPWTAEPPLHAEDRCGWKIGNRGLGGHGWLATGYAPISPLSEADARLIAAAPDTAAERDRLRAVNVELVAALNLFVAAADRGATVFYDLRGSCLSTARAAIAKAQS